MDAILEFTADSARFGHPGLMPGEDWGVDQKPRRASWWVIACVIAGLLLIAEPGYVHSRYGEFRFSPTATPPKIPFGGRDYARSPEAPTAGIGWISTTPAAIGHTWGGGEVWGTPDAGYDRTVIWIHSDDFFYAYTLKGGP
jgi:hypothetical protein